LRQAATAGHVIIVNVSNFGTDVLVFGTTGSIEHIALLDVDLESLTDLSRGILLHRPINATEDQQTRYIKHYMKPALRLVWNNILIPVFGKIGVSLAVPSASHHIWWYPTGPLTFIPIHAAGPV
jgi:hypothetical protein